MRFLEKPNPIGLKNQNTRNWNEYRTDSFRFWILWPLKYGCRLLWRMCWSRSPYGLWPGFRRSNGNWQTRCPALVAPHIRIRIRIPIPIPIPMLILIPTHIHMGMGMGISMGMGMGPGAVCIPMPSIHLTECTNRSERTNRIFMIRMMRTTARSRYSCGMKMAAIYAAAMAATAVGRMGPIMSPAKLTVTTITITMGIIIISRISINTARARISMKMRNFIIAMDVVKMSC